MFHKNSNNIAYANSNGLWQTYCSKKRGFKFSWGAQSAELFYINNTFKLCIHLFPTITFRLTSFIDKGIAVTFIYHLTNDYIVSGPISEYQLSLFTWY